VYAVCGETNVRGGVHREGTILTQSNEVLLP